MKRIIIALSFVVIVSSLTGQQLPYFSQYNLNHYSINPAATGVTETLPIAFVYRKQWANMPQSPTSQYISGHTEIYKDMGVGAKILNYTFGPQRKTGMELTYSYHLEFQNDMKLSFGLSGLFYQFHLGKSKLSIEDPNDQLFAGDENMFVVDAIFGSYLYGKNYYAGISIPQLFNRNVDLKTDNILQEKQVRHYYIQGGYKFDIAPDITLEPSTLIKLMESGLYQVDINALAEYKKMVSLGLSFRTYDALSIQLGYIYKGWRFGYAFDIAVSKVRMATYGSHEIMVMYTLPGIKL
jgi:type IX secretion system PorP/SprF family membrane protein